MLNWIVRRFRLVPVRMFAGVFQQMNPGKEAYAQPLIGKGKVALVLIVSADEGLRDKGRKGGRDWTSPNGPHYEGLS